MVGSGGASVLSREEIAEARAEAEEEFERESKKGKDTRKKKGAKKSLAEAVDDFGSLFGDGLTGKLPRFANRITLKVSSGFNSLCLRFASFSFIYS